MNHAHALVTVCPYVNPTSEDIKLHNIIIIIKTNKKEKKKTFWKKSRSMAEKNMTRRKEQQN